MQSEIQELIKEVESLQESYNNFEGTEEEDKELLLLVYKAKNRLESHPDYIKYMAYQNSIRVKLLKNVRRLSQSIRRLLVRVGNFIKHTYSKLRR